MNTRICLFLTVLSVNLKRKKTVLGVKCVPPDLMTINSYPASLLTFSPSYGKTALFFYFDNSTQLTHKLYESLNHPRQEVDITSLWKERCLYH